MDFLTCVLYLVIEMSDTEKLTCRHVFVSEKYGCGKNYRFKRKSNLKSWKNHRKYVLDELDDLHGTKVQIHHMRYWLKNNKKNFLASMMVW